MAEVKISVPDSPTSVPGSGAKARKAPVREPDRRIYVKGANRSYVDAKHSETHPYLAARNEVLTSRYRWWDFIFLNLFEQFSNVANLYFLGIGLLQICPAISTTGGNPTMYQPLAFIVFVSAIRAASEDISRHRADAQRNGYKYDVLTENGWGRAKSGELSPGNVIRVKKDEMIPADCIFLGSSNPKGHCFIDKANLNGETTLEVLSSLQQTRQVCDNDGKLLGSLDCEIEYEPPNKRFDSIRGTMYVNSGGQRQEAPLSGKVLLMRETNLKNTDYIFGLVVYTGNDTKIQRSNLDGEKAKIKVSRIMRYVQRFLKVMLLAQCALCIFGAIWSSVWLGGHKDALYLFPPGGKDVNHHASGFYSFFSWFILLSQMVPISLIVSSELVKFAQSKFIQWDRSLYWAPIDKPTKCNSSTIHEDLGLIDYIFSDKTGTLTQNKMEFRYALLPFEDFGSKETEISKAVKRRQEEVRQRNEGTYRVELPTPWSTLVKPLLPPNDPANDCCTTTCFSPIWNAVPRPEEKNLGKDAGANCFTQDEKEEMLRALWGPVQPDENKEAAAKRKAQIRLYLTHMALSNTVKPYEDEGKLKFQAEAAEETAMVNFAANMGFLKRSQNPTILQVTEYSEDLQTSSTVDEEYVWLATMGFTSARARVTVVYKKIDRATGHQSIWIMSKGQDTVILPLLKTCPNKEALMLELSELCTNGLRTLVCGHAEQPVEWWNSRKADYDRVVAMDESEYSQGHSDGKCAKDRCEKCAMHNLFEQFEKDAELSYMGCMGLEDQLQLLVPECIKDCLRANIRVWMITGDKLETAKNIGLACNLIDPDMLPQIKPGQSREESISAFASSRLIEITGQWATLGQKREELEALYDLFDQDNDGVLNYDELKDCLRALRAPAEDNLKEMFGIRADGGGEQGKATITREKFVEFMRSSAPTMYDAVLMDVEEGLQTYKLIADHEAQPVSMLVNRSAFEVMYPGKLPPGAVPDPDAPSEEKLEELRKKFFELAAVSKSLVFARAQPAMKKRMVTEIQARVPGATTLAIGDGANDTDMIMAAHIGVGIAGVEGTAATNSADYAIGSFSLLHTLLFVHGFWSYHRISQLVNFIFYKASLIALTGYYFGFFSGFSGQQFYNDPPYQMYNVVYTALPIMAVAILNKELPRDTLQNNPSLYREAKGNAFSPAVFFGWVLRAVLHSLIIFFIPYSVLGQQDVVTSEGRAHDHWFFSTTVFFAVVLVPTFLILLEMSTITLMHVLALFSSLGSVFLFTFFFSITISYNPDLYGVIGEMFSSGTVWLTIIVTTALPIILEMAYRGVANDLWPSYNQIWKERIYNRRVDKRQKRKQELARIPRGAPRPPESRTSAEVIVSPDDEKVWAEARSPKAADTQRRLSASKLDATGRRETYVSQPASKEDQLRAAVVQAMLRLSNLTGSQFASAAQARFQDHDRDPTAVASPSASSAGASAPSQVHVASS